VLDYAQDIKAATLIMNGGKDDRTDPSQACQLADMINAGGGSARVIIYPNYGHYLPVVVRNKLVDPFIDSILAGKRNNLTPTGGASGNSSRGSSRGIGPGISPDIPAPPPPQRSPYPLRRVWVDSRVMTDSLIYNPLPKYPPLAKARGVEGSVDMEVLIGKNGSVQQLRVIGGDPRLRAAAVNAVKRWRYEPVKIRGYPVEVVTQVVIHFIWLNAHDAGVY
jgi:TonB family protein